MEILEYFFKFEDLGLSDLKWPLEGLGSHFSDQVNNFNFFFAYEKSSYVAHFRDL